MKLQYIRYQNASGTKYMLALILGVHNNMLCCIDANKVPAAVKTQLRAMRTELDKMDGQAIYQWFNERIPQFNGSGLYKTIPISKVAVEHSFEVGE